MKGRTRRLGRLHCGGIGEYGNWGEPRQEAQGSGKEAQTSKNFGEADQADGFGVEIGDPSHSRWYHDRFRFGTFVEARSEETRARCVEDSS